MTTLKKTLLVSLVLILPLAILNCGDSNDNVEGCTDPTAFNYDESADTDNGGCTYTSSLSITIESITHEGVTITSNIDNSGSTNISAAGVVYSTEPEPEIDDFPASATVTLATGDSFTTVLGGLDRNTTYFVRAFGQNSVGVAYSNEISFTTDELVHDGAGNTYEVVTIDTQNWLGENLITTKLNDGTDIPEISDNTTWSTMTTPGYSWYDNDETTYGEYGALYNWHTINTAKLCPAGWHVPSQTEWVALQTHLGGESVAAGPLKAEGTDHWASPNVGATNSTGFTALPTGFRSAVDGTFNRGGEFGYYWSSTEESVDNAYFSFIRNTATIFPILSDAKEFGIGVRCLED